LVGPKRIVGITLSPLKMDHLFVSGDRAEKEVIIPMLPVRPPSARSRFPRRAGRRIGLGPLIDRPPKLQGFQFKIRRELPFQVMLAFLTVPPSQLCPL
jgi:hypothetical protein